MRLTWIAKLDYRLYRFRCWLHGHRYDCCGNAKAQCSKCEYAKGSVR